MRHTLEQLKAMSGDELHQRWFRGEFPFDPASGCRHCITSHNLEIACELSNHANLRNRAKELWGKIIEVEGTIGHGILAHLEEFYALRIFYDHLYPQPTVEKTHAEVLAKAIERQKERIEESYLEMRADLHRRED